MSDTVFEKNGRTLTVRPMTRLDAVTSVAFGNELYPQLNDVQELILDFENVDYISSSCLRVILGAVQQLEPREGTIKAINVSDYVKGVLDLSGFHAYVTIS